MPLADPERIFLERRNVFEHTSKLRKNMVEAGGIEPPSEGLPATATTRLVRDF